MENAGKNDWLASQSLERSLDVISAINRISIHAKLRLAGIADTTTRDELNSARRSLKHSKGSWPPSSALRTLLLCELRVGLIHKTGTKT